MSIRGHKPDHKIDILIEPINTGKYIIKRYEKEELI